MTDERLVYSKQYFHPGCPQRVCSVSPLDLTNVFADYDLSRRPADIRASYHASAAKATKFVKRQSAGLSKKRKGKATVKRKTPQKNQEKQDSYHFIGFVPCDGKVWELDGLRFSGPLEVGDIPQDANWIDIVRPALKMRMQRFIPEAKKSDHIRYSLLAVVDDRYCKTSDELEMLKRERIALERRLQEAHSDAWTKHVCSPTRFYLKR